MTTATKKLNAVEADEQREWTEWRPLSKTQLYRTRVQVEERWYTGRGLEQNTYIHDVSLLEYRIAEELVRWYGAREPELDDLEDLVGTVKHTPVSYSFAVPRGQDADKIRALFMSDLGRGTVGGRDRDFRISEGKSGTRIVVRKD